VIKGLLQSPPAPAADAHKAYFVGAFQEKWAEFESEYQNETDSEEKPGGQTSAAGSDEPNNEGSRKDNNDSDGEPMSKEQVMDLARRRASELYSLWVTTLNPASTAADALASLLKSKEQTVALGRMLAFFNPRCDDEPRVPNNKNYYRFIAPVSKDRLLAFCGAADQIMQPGRDVVAILEGQVWSNRAVIGDVIAKKGWRCRNISLTYHERTMARPCSKRFGQEETHKDPRVRHNDLVRHALLALQRKGAQSPRGCAKVHQTWGVCGQ
jgi:hypothetical protein